MSKLMEEFEGHLGRIQYGPADCKTCREERNWFRTAIEALEKERDEAVAENKVLRKLLWLRHGCDISAL